MAIKLPEAHSCYFCDLLKVDDHWSLVTQGKFTVTCLNGRQFETGQCVVVPRRHGATLLDLNDDECQEVMTAARQIGEIMVDVFAPLGILLYQNNGEGSGQEVPHFHLHVVPRQQGSDWGLGPPHVARLEARPAKLDHARVTDEKVAMSYTLRKRAESCS